MANETILRQETVDLKDGKVILVTKIRAAAASTVVTIPAPSNTGSGATLGSKGTNRTTAVSIAVLLENGQPASEVKTEVSDTSTTPSATIAASANDTAVPTTDRTSTVTIVTGGSTAIAAGDVFYLVSLHDQSDLNVVSQKFQ